MAKHTVLYVEDEENDVFFMGRAFQKTSPESVLLSVSDGQKAIAYLQGDGAYADRNRYPLPTLMLLDLNLPVRSGFEVLQWLRGQSQFECLPVIVFSSSGRPEDQEQARKLGANDYLLKPSSGMEFTKTAQEFQQRWL